MVPQQDTESICSHRRVRLNRCSSQGFAAASWPSPAPRHTHQSILLTLWNAQTLHHVVDCHAHKRSYAYKYTPTEANASNSRLPKSNIYGATPASTFHVRAHTTWSGIRLRESRETKLAMPKENLHLRPGVTKMSSRRP